MTKTPSRTDLCLVFSMCLSEIHFLVFSSNDRVSLCFTRTGDVLTAAVPTTEPAILPVTTTPAGRLAFLLQGIEGGHRGPNTGMSPSQTWHHAEC